MVRRTADDEMRRTTPMGGRWMRVSLAALLAVTLVFVAGCSQGSETTPQTTQPSEQQQDGTGSADTSATQDTTPAAEEVTELKIEDLVVGTGAEAKTGNTVSVHYTGWLTDGTKFDSSVDRGQPFQFTIGQGRVIRGWDEGVPGMKVGGKRKLTIPPDMGYGANGSPPVIPPNATLVFEVELLGVQ